MVSDSQDQILQPPDARRSALVPRDTDIVALVCAGQQGRAVLEALLRVPGVEIRYLVELDRAGPAAALARENGIRCRTDGGLDELLADPDVSLILETTDRPEVVAALEAGGRPDTRVIGGAGARLVARLLAELADVDERAIVEKARYLRQASHQLKSPLSSIQSYVNAILGGYAGEIPERTRDIVEKIHAICDAALRALAKRRMLADLRCVDRAGLEPTAVHLGELVDWAIEAQAALAQARDVEIGVAPPAGPDLVRCEPDATVALLSELLENAVVYSSEHGRVEVAVEAQPDARLAVSVRDHGIGIPARSLARVFDEDYRADPAVKHYRDGAGLGLAIAREIADLQGFGLDVQSEEGHGAVFTLSVPATPTT